MLVEGSCSREAEIAGTGYGLIRRDGVAMDLAPDEASHEAAVDAWLARSVDRDSSIDLIRRFRAALEAVWDRSLAILSPVTLTALAERVLHDTSERYTFLSAI